MRVFSLALLAALSACTQADDPGGAGATSGQAGRAGTSRGTGADTADALATGTFRRAAGESADSFAARAAPPGAGLTHPVIATDVWSPGDTALIAFYSREFDTGRVLEPGETAYHEAAGYALLPDSAHRYRRVEIGVIEHNGGDPEIRSVFFANADQDPGPELVVIAAWNIRHYDFSGTLYGTHVYALRSGAGEDRFVFLEDVSEKVSGTCDCALRDGGATTSRFKTAAEVRAGLRALGYR